MSPGARYLDGARMAAAVLWTLSAKPAKELLRSGDRRVTLSVDLGRVVLPLSFVLKRETFSKSVEGQIGLS
jgi:hypothetical protein